MALLKVSTTRNRVVFMTDTTDHVSGKTGLTLTVTASKDGAAFAGISPGVGDLGSGWYVMTLTTVHTNTLGDLALHITAAATDPTDLLDQVISFLPGENDSTMTAAFTTLTAAATLHTSGLSTLTAASTVITANITTLTAASTVLTAAATFTTASLTSVTASMTTLTAAATLHTSGLSTLTAASTVITANITTVTAQLTAVRAKTDLIPGTPSSVSDIPTAAVIADAVWDEAGSGHTAAGTTGRWLQMASTASGGGGGATVQQIVDGVFNEDFSTHTTSGTFGEFLRDKALTVTKFLGLQDGD